MAVIKKEKNGLSEGTTTGSRQVLDVCSTQPDDLTSDVKTKVISTHLVINISFLVTMGVMGNHDIRSQCCVMLVTVMRIRFSEFQICGEGLETVT
jgi:hypothetical protein